MAPRRVAVKKWQARKMCEIFTTPENKGNGFKYLWGCQVSWQVNFRFFFPLAFFKQNAVTLIYESVGVLSRRARHIWCKCVTLTTQRLFPPFFCRGGSLATPGGGKTKTLRNILIKIHCPKKEQKRDYQNHRQTG